MGEGSVLRPLHRIGLPGLPACLPAYLPACMHAYLPALPCLALPGLAWPGLVCPGMASLSSCLPGHIQLARTFSPKAKTRFALRARV